MDLVFVAQVAIVTATVGIVGYILGRFDGRNAVWRHIEELMADRVTGHPR